MCGIYLHTFKKELLQDKMALRLNLVYESDCSSSCT